MILRRVLSVFLLNGSLLTAAELVPVEKFAADFTLSRARLSPDGKSFAFLRQTDEGQLLKIVDFAAKTSALVDPGKTMIGVRKEVGEFQWISDQRISFMTTVWDGTLFTGVSAVDRDGKRWQAYTGVEVNPTDSFPLLATRIIYAFSDAEQSVLMVERLSHSGKNLAFPNVVKVSTLTGFYKTVLKNPGNVVYWVVDRQGAVRLGVTQEGLRFGAIYRETETSVWRQLPLFDEKLGRVAPVGFDYDGRRLLVATDSDKNRRALYFYDVTEGKLGELIADHPEYDMIPEMGAPYVDGVTLAGPVISDMTQTVVGVRYMTDGPRMVWFDSGLASLQGAINLTLPNTVNLITSRSRDEKKFLVLAFSDRDPGKYYLLDISSGKPVFNLIGSQIPDFPVEQMAPMHPIEYIARDGQKIHGYLTMPVEKKKGLPLVVLPHGGPNLRDVWGYDWMVQFLANRGYAVLQMNYRGSPGYGSEFYVRGKHEIGRGIQNDIDDGARWAIAQGFADPARVGIVGGSYGGYSALYALGNSPELYRCGISIAGVTDWAEIFKERKADEYKFAFLHFQEWIGDPKTDAEFLASISPVNFAAKIKAPVFIVQGKEDRTVPPKQARRMVAALEKAGNKPQTLYFPNEGHGFAKEKNRAKLLREIEAFLAKNLAPVSGN
jgi:dipeptidyl aminopeptidase/acylaminoacyl peptidase